MDDEKIYGKVFHEMSFKQAIDANIICDYKILTVAVSGSEVANLMAEHTEVTAQLDSENVETDAHTLAAGIAIEKVFQKHGIKHAISFHNGIKRAEDFCSQQTAFGGKLGSKLEVKNRNISSRLSAGQRSRVLKNSTNDDYSLITNARCLTEGIDIPEIDCVAFIDPKRSVVDIVQAAGRAMRRSDKTGKTYGYILLPIIVPVDSSLEEFADTTDFRAVARVLAVLSTQDTRIAEQMRLTEPGQPPNPGDVIVIDSDIAEILDVDYQTFFDVISTKIWNTVGRANWRPFEEARDFMRSLKISGQTEFYKWSSSKKRPPDIPSRPDYIYPEYVDLQDWLGTSVLSNQNRTYWSFEKARHFVRCQGLLDLKEWNEWKKAGKRPHYIPSSPHTIYKDQGFEIRDFLGRDWWPFEQARIFARELNLQGQTDWNRWNKANQLPVLFQNLQIRFIRMWVG